MQQQHQLITQQNLQPQYNVPQQTVTDNGFGDCGFSGASPTPTSKPPTGTLFDGNQEWAEFSFSKSTTASPQPTNNSQQQYQLQQENNTFNSGSIPPDPKCQVELLLERSLNFGSGADKKDPKQGFQKVEINRRIGGYKEVHQASVKSANWGNLTADMSDMFKDEETLKREKAEAEAAALVAKEEALQKALQAQFAAQKMADEQQHAAAILYQQQTQALEEQERSNVREKNSGTRDIDQADDFGDFEGDEPSSRRGSQGDRHKNNDRDRESRHHHRATEQRSRRSDANYRDRYEKQEDARHRRVDGHERAYERTRRERNGGGDGHEKDIRIRRGTDGVADKWDRRDDGGDGHEKDIRIRRGMDGVADKWDRRDDGGGFFARHRVSTEIMDKNAGSRDKQRSSGNGKAVRPPAIRGVHENSGDHQKEVHKIAAPILKINLHTEGKMHMPAPPQLHLETLATEGIDRVTSPDLPVENANSRQNSASRENRRNARQTPTERERARRAERERGEGMPPHKDEETIVERSHAVTKRDKIVDREARRQADREALDGPSAACHKGNRFEGAKRDLLQDSDQTKRDRDGRRAFGDFVEKSTSNDGAVLPIIGLHPSSRSSTQVAAPNENSNDFVDWARARQPITGTKVEDGDDAFGEFESEMAENSDHTNYFKRDDEASRIDPGLVRLASTGESTRRRKGSGSVRHTIIKNTASNSILPHAHVVPHESVPEGSDAGPDLDIWAAPSSTKVRNSLDLGFRPADEIDDDGDDYGYSFGGSFGVGLAETSEDRPNISSNSNELPTHDESVVFNPSLYSRGHERSEREITAERGLPGDSINGDLYEVANAQIGSTKSSTPAHLDHVSTGTIMVSVGTPNAAKDLFASFTNGDEDDRNNDDDFGDFGGFDTNFEENLAPGMGIAMAFSTQAYSHDPAAPDHDVQSKYKKGNEASGKFDLSIKEDHNEVDLETPVSDVDKVTTDAKRAMTVASDQSDPHEKEYERDEIEQPESSPAVIRKFSEDSPAYIKAREFAEHATGSVNYDDALSTFMTDLDTLVAEKKATEHEHGIDENKNKFIDHGRQPSLVRKVAPGQNTSRIATPPPTDGDLYSYFRSASESENPSETIHDRDSLSPTVDDRESKWSRLLTRCMAVLTTAQRTLDRMQHTASKITIEEVMEAPQTRNYLIGIAEIYMLSRRIQAGVDEDMVGCCRLMEDIDRVWQGLIPHVEGICLTQVNEVEYEGIAKPSSSIQPESANVGNVLRDGKEVFNCAICLCYVRVTNASNKESTDPVSENDNVVQGEEDHSAEPTNYSYQPNTAVAHINGSVYHVTCANFWIREVTPSVPNLRCQ
ncbi:hypothetical protein SARC_08733 [Sphaeroforma arctica JP610]|uniref:Synergin gamma C-terminal domain-containing protein n=1 Tax=Sphaeroforma arctica JP610 TaxID=667725 RepID=A0A0L0FQ58_9EUKA|nr:hypothetical protein SARC_08733 [Sphaeroforma arctica JP610]KNC78849.1 hypothetical protein SARC_08733 [Sphaeroforma arctica JP610]|eukprot:XP_014152751.1 hypothetical protein SARC_08733 [Sphaeroforma arctica JP610]